MRPFQRATTIAGCLCLLVALLLASPGVRVVRAAGGDTAATGSCAPSGCPGSAAAPRNVEVEKFLANLRGQQARSAGDSKDVIVELNNQGYNYRPMPLPNRGRVRLDAGSQR